MSSSCRQQTVPTPHLHTLLSPFYPADMQYLTSNHTGGYRNNISDLHNKMSPAPMSYSALHFANMKIEPILFSSATKTSTPLPKIILTFSFYLQILTMHTSFNLKYCKNRHFCQKLVNNCRIFFIIASDLNLKKNVFNVEK